MYNNNFIVVIKHKGKVLRDTSSIVTLPFGAEYSIMLKNINTRTAVASIEVDGVDVMEGNSLVVPANKSVELKGFMHGGKVSNKFKFIEKTSTISNFRGDRPDDGLVRVEFTFEKPINQTPYYHYDNLYGNTSAYNSGNPASFNTTPSFFCCVNGGPCSDGITVEGSRTKQNFVARSVGLLDNSSDVIVLKLQGRKRSTGKLVKNPVTVKTKKQCTTCGKRWSYTHKFCGACGTYLR